MKIRFQAFIAEVARIEGMSVETAGILTMRQVAELSQVGELHPFEALALRSVRDHGPTDASSGHGMMFDGLWAAQRRGLLDTDYTRGNRVYLNMNARGLKALAWHELCISNDS